MKKAFAAACAVCLAAALFSVIALSAGAVDTPASTDISSAEELLPVDVQYSHDRLDIRKVYELSPDTNPGSLPREGFELNGYAYECADILREVVIGEDFKTVTMTETAETKKDDTASVFAVLPQYIEYSDEDGFSGRLLLNTSTIKSEVSGYGTYSTPYTVSRSYPNLSDCDTQYIPKTTDDNGRTLQLQDIQWQTDNTMNVDDYEIGNRYTAVATYGGTRSSSYVTGYDITADYTGEVLHKGVTAIRYTVIFTGVEIPPPVPEPEPLPEPAEPEPEPEPEVWLDKDDTAKKTSSGSSLVWLPTLMSILSLLGSGLCAYFTYTNRKETPHYETAPDYNDPYGYDNPYDDLDGDPGDGDVDI